MATKPARIQPGMTVGVISPASGAADETTIDAAIEGLESLGLGVKVGKFARSRLGYLAATDAERLGDLHAAFRDKKVDAIMCLRGGYGCLRIADGLDFDLIRKNPKALVGFSDITTLSLAMLKRANLVTFSGPVMTFTFAPTKKKMFTVEGMLRTVGRPEAAGSIWQGHPEERSKGGRKFRVVTKGRASGALVGGCLTLVTASVGTSHQIETKGRIVFLEDVDERPYRVDRALTQLLSAGLLKDAAGIAVGRVTPDVETVKRERGLRGTERVTSRMVPKAARRAEARDWEPTMDEVVAERLRPLGIPVVLGLPFGHVPDYATLPFGVRATLDAEAGELMVDEAAVR